MSNVRLLAVAIVAGLVAGPVLAQQPRTATPPSGATPGVAPGLTATTNNPNLAVATLKLESGVRAGKIIGAAVYSDANEKVGTVDDLILTDGDKATVAIVSVGGFLGIGSKLVAVPFSQLKRDGDKVTLLAVTRESLNTMPGFVY